MKSKPKLPEDEQRKILSPDRTKVRLARAVEEALGDESYGADYGISYTKEWKRSGTTA